MQQPLFVRNAKQLITLKGTTDRPVTKEKMNDLQIIENGSVWIEDGEIKEVGPDKHLLELFGSRIDEALEVNASGKLVTPGLIDSHTHIIYSGSRVKEYEMRLKGSSYMEIMNEGGGIHNTTTATRKASVEELYQLALNRLNTSLLYGTTTMEVKSGYGLTLKDELKHLRIIKQLDQDHPIDIAPTFLGAHAIPSEYKNNPEEYVEHVINDMIPKVANENLAEFIDITCEKDVFTPKQAERILRAGQRHGLKAKIHADEIVRYGGAILAAKIKAISAEHLLKVTKDDIDKLEDAGVIAVLLPGTPFILKMKPANARKIIDGGVPVAISTDNNPGTSPTESLQLIMQLGCFTMDMTPEEVFVSTTINAAHAINKNKEVGSLEVGKKGDLVIFNSENYVELLTRIGINLVEVVVKNGEIVVRNGKIVQ